MSEPIPFDTDLYNRDALDAVARKYATKARVELIDSGKVVVAHLEPLGHAGDEQTLRDEFCTEVFSATARRRRETLSTSTPPHERKHAGTDTPPWDLLAPFTAGAALGLGWQLESLSPIQSGATNLVLRHELGTTARVAIRRHDGNPHGVAHTQRLDFLVMNGGGGNARTDDSVAAALTSFADVLRQHHKPHIELLAANLSPIEEPSAAKTAAASAGRGRADDLFTQPPHIDREQRTISFDLDATAFERCQLYDAVLAFAERCSPFLVRADEQHVSLQLKAHTPLPDEALGELAEEIAAALRRAVHNSSMPAASATSETRVGLPPLSQLVFDMEDLLAELAAADATTLGLGFQPERSPGHQGLGVLNILGTGACNSDCLFCCEKFVPNNRLTPNADATRQLILNSSGRFDMLFFASGEPTIHPKLFEYVELARGVGFTSFGMSSHFRTFADPQFTLKTLQAGFQYFDISLHAADAAGQLDINPIDDGGDSLFEALKGLAILYRLAAALGIRITVTHKIVVSKLNLTRLDDIFHATFDRGVRHFILQPARTFGLPPERQSVLAISEDEIMPHLNRLLRDTVGLGVTIKPYGFSRAQLFDGAHIEHEQNRVKNISGKARLERGRLRLPRESETRPNDGRHWVELRSPTDDRFGFAADRGAVVLDEGLRRGADLPFGCRMGSCGMCCAHLVEGSVDQSTQIFLSEEQVQQGYVLLCQARPLSNVVVKLCTDDEIDRL